MNLIAIFDLSRAEIEALIEKGAALKREPKGARTRDNLKGKTLALIFEKPHTSCGCFEVAGFYIPEVDGIGWVHRGSKVSETAIGLPFSTVAGSVGGGKQVSGFLGIGVQYFYSPKFIQYDGGWRQI